MIKEIQMYPQPQKEITEIIKINNVWLAYIKQKHGQEYEINCPFSIGQTDWNNKIIKNISASKMNGLWYWVLYF